MSDEKEMPKWVLFQQKTFTKWINNHLKKGGFDPIEVTDFPTAWEDGELLMNLISHLYELPIPRHKAAKSRIGQLDNITLALKMLEEDAGVKTNFLKRENLVDHDQKMLLGMAWSIILDYSIKGISVEDMKAKDGLLMWVRKKTKGYRDVDPPGVNNFSKSWVDGMAFCALIHRHRPELIDYDSLDKKNRAENLELAFSVAERELDIPRLLDVEDLLEMDRPDERPIITYVSEFFHRFASQDLKETAARRVANFVDFMREMERRQYEYEQRAAALIQWCDTTSHEFGSTDFGDSLDRAVECFNSFRHYLTVDKPAKAGEKLDIEANFAEIQTELAVNGRRPYVPDASLTPDQIETHWQQLTESERQHGAQVRNNRFRFIEKKESVVPEEKVKEFTDAFKHFDTNGSDTLDLAEFKAALMALSIPFANDEALKKVFDEVSGGNEFITKEQYIRYNVGLAEDRDTADQVKASFAAVADQADSVTEDQLRMPPLTDEQRDWLRAHMTAGADGSYDYKSLVDQMFVSE